MLIQDLTTPCALVDVDRVERNCLAMAERVTRLGARLRPHVKTHKCVEIAKMQVRGHFGGIAVSTLAEARHFAAAGFEDVTWAVPLAPSRVREAAEVAEGIDRLNLVLDDETVLWALEEYARGAGSRFRVLLKVDCGYHRAGVDPEGMRGLCLARSIHDSEHVEFVGVLAHGGHAYSRVGRDAILQVAEEERSVTTRFADRLRREGVPVPEVSIGSTPTMAVATSLDGVTEARPGNYPFFDAFQTAIGSCGIDDVAFSVLTSVIGRYPARNTAVVDAGSLALSRDPGARHADPDTGFGRVFDLGDAAELGSVRITSLSQEHGKIEGEREVIESLRVGRKVRIVPNHACLSAALFDRYHAVKDGEVVDEWRPCRGW